jgi:hypothetical protein
VTAGGDTAAKAGRGNDGTIASAKALGPAQLAGASHSSCEDEGLASSQPGCRRDSSGSSAGEGSTEASGEEAEGPVAVDAVSGGMGQQGAAAEQQEGQDHQEQLRELLPPAAERKEGSPQQPEGAPQELAAVLQRPEEKQGRQQSEDPPPAAGEHQQPPGKLGAPPAEACEGLRAPVLAAGEAAPQRPQPKPSGPRPRVGWWDDDAGHWRESGIRWERTEGRVPTSAPPATERVEGCMYRTDAPLPALPRLPLTPAHIYGRAHHPPRPALTDRASPAPSDVTYCPKARLLAFSSQRLGRLALVAPRLRLLPYRSWDLRPTGGLGGSSVVLTLRVRVRTQTASLPARIFAWHMARAGLGRGSGGAPPL